MIVYCLAESPGKQQIVLSSPCDVVRNLYLFQWLSCCFLAHTFIGWLLFDAHLIKTFIHGRGTADLANKLLRQALFCLVRADLVVTLLRPSCIRGHSLVCRARSAAAICTATLAALVLRQTPDWQGRLPLLKSAIHH